MRSAYNVAIRSAAYYESRAEEVRTIAEMTADPWCQKVLNGIVDDYVRLAGDRLTEEARGSRRKAE